MRRLLRLLKGASEGLLQASSEASLSAPSRHASTRAFTSAVGGGLFRAASLITGAIQPSIVGGALGMRGFAANASGMKVYKPVTPGQRGRITTSRAGLWNGRPLRALTKGLRKSGGRNNQGRITSYQKGGGARRLYRMVDFKRTIGDQAVVRRIEYDPNRSARIALVDYSSAGVASSQLSDKPRSAYIIAPEGLKAGDTVMQGEGASIFPGNSMPLMLVPVGSTVHNVELRPGCGGKMVRSAGAAATLLAKQDNGYALLRMPSGEQRMILLQCMATIGSVGNKEHKNRKLGKAGISRHLGRRPHVRGVAMNPVDHPHGGGEGRTSGGRPSCSPWAIPTKGYRTRNKNKSSSKYITQRRAP